MKTITIHAADSLIVDFPITFPTTGSITSMSGTATVSADPIAGGAMISGAASIAGNIVTGTWAAGVFAVGVYRLQCKATISGQVQTVAEAKLDVKESNA